MLALAVSAGLPVIRASTTDLLNFADVVKFLTAKTPAAYPLSDVKQKFQAGRLYWLRGSEKHSSALYERAYAEMAESEASLIVVNPKVSSDVFFDAGEVPVPKELVRQFLEAALNDSTLVSAVMPALGGLTLKDVAEVVRLSCARDGSLTPVSVMKTRRQCFPGSRGVTLVNTDQVHYRCPEKLDSWLQRESHFLLDENLDPRLRPRGLLLDGPPGTGKSAAAKYIASQLGVPLYKVDVGTMKGRYVGDSEGALMAALARLDYQEPNCVLLDEIEKAFSTSTSDTSGVTSSMLSQLLWWLAERTTRVFVIATTNKAKALPPELYREGRFDEVMVFEGFHEIDQALEFAAFQLNGFKIKHTEAAFGFISARLKALMKATSQTGAVSHAAITKLVTECVKQALITAETGS